MKDTGTAEEPQVYLPAPESKGTAASTPAAEEIDQHRKVWTIPASRMKTRRPHTVPLSARCLEILDQVRDLRRDDALVFPGTIPGRPLSDMTFTKLMRDAGVDAVPH